MLGGLALAAAAALAIPPALQGCWRLDDPDRADHLATLHITAHQLVERADWRSAPITVRIERIDRATPTRVVGLMSYPESGGLATFATGLSLGPDGLGTPPGMLRVSEGDAGSRWYRRCPAKG
jgi:hypothetical protein